MSAEDKLITIKEACKILGGIGRPTLDKRVKEGRIVKIKAEKGVKLWRSDVMRHANDPMALSPLRDAPLDDKAPVEAAPHAETPEDRLRRVAIMNGIPAWDHGRLEALREALEREAVADQAFKASWGAKA